MPTGLCSQRIQLPHVEPWRHDEGGDNRAELRGAAADEQPKLFKACERYSALARYATRKRTDHLVGLILSPCGVGAAHEFQHRARA